MNVPPGVVNFRQHSIVQLDGVDLRHERRVSFGIALVPEKIDDLYARFRELF